MLIREYRQTDLDALRAIHAAQGFDYALPDLNNPLFVTKLVFAEKTRSKGNDAGPKTTTPEAQDERIIGAALLRLTAETYLLLDPRIGSPSDRWHCLLALHAATECDAWQRGLEDVHAWLPPPIARKFGKRIERLGWVRDDAWTPYCRKLAARE
jgi:hypothetical protein